ncbi:MAG: adenosine deaminase [Solirubrobacterales bacterium]|nr:adenosine deaminase [Solirubrobacterales bacterium]
MPDVPKAELHVHLEGTARPALIRRLAARNGVALPAGLFADEETFAWTDFLDFLTTYDLAASVLRTAEDYRDLVHAYLSECAAEGAIYVEMIASPDHARAVGLPEAEHRAGLFAGIDDARTDHGIEGRILVTAIRNLGVEAAERTAREAAALAHPYVVGFNLAGDEAGFPPAPFARAFQVAHDAGLGCTVHAGEHAGPASIREALALPGVRRLSHGVRAVEDPALVARLAEERIVLEVCPTSNVVLGVYEDYAAHPFTRLRDAGVLVTLASDDPPFFGASIGGEYGVARTHFGLQDDALLDITRTALRAGFLDETTRRDLLERLGSAGSAL